MPHAPGSIPADPVVSERRRRETMLVFGAPALGQAEIDEVVATLRSGWIGTGPRVARLEREFAAYKGVASAVALNSCTSALHLAMIAADIGPGDEVITTPLTFCATANAILHAGATPVLADVDPVTMNIDPEEVARRVTPRTRAIVPVHFAGRPCAMDELLEIARARDLIVIEDCAHAIETRYRGRAAGTLGDFGCFSFYVTKNMTTGEGGMVLSSRPEALDRIKMLALHGMSRDAWKRFGDEGYRHYQVVDAGFKCNMMDIQAAIGIHQLARVESNREIRRAIWERYQEAFSDLPLTLPSPIAAHERHSYHLYTVLVDEERAGIHRDAFLDALAARNIGVGVHYLSLPEHPSFRTRFGWKAEGWPCAARIGRTTASLPLSPGLTDEDVEDVIDAVRRALGRPTD